MSGAILAEVTVAHFLVMAEERRLSSELRKLLVKSEAEKEALRRELNRVTRGVHGMTGDYPGRPLWDEPAYLSCPAWHDPAYVFSGSQCAGRTLHAGDAPVYVVPLDAPAHEPSMPGSSTAVDGGAAPPPSDDGNDEGGEVEVEVDDEGGQDPRKVVVWQRWEQVYAELRSYRFWQRAADYAQRAALSPEIRGLMCGGERSLSRAVAAYNELRATVARRVVPGPSETVASTKVAWRRVRDAITWRCARSVGIDNKEAYFETLDEAFNGQVRSDYELKSQLLGGYHHFFRVLVLAFKSKSKQRTRPRPRRGPRERRGEAPPLPVEVRLALADSGCVSCEGPGPWEASLPFFQMSGPSGRTYPAPVDQVSIVQRL